MLPQPEDLREFVAMRHQEMMRQAEQNRLASEAKPAWRWAVPNLQKILTQMIAKLEAPEVEEKPVQPEPSKLATDSGTFRIR